MKKTLALLLSLPCLAHADDLDYGVAKLQWYYHSDLEADDASAQDLSQQQWRLQTAFSKPLNLTDSIFLIPMFRYELTEIESFGLGFTPYEKDLHSIELPMLFVMKENGSPWSYNLRLNPGIASDFEDIDNDDFFLDARVGAEYKFSDSLSLNFGLAYTRLTGEPTILPFAGFQYDMNDQWQFALRGPTLQARYQLSEDWLVRFVGEPGGGMWNIEEFGSQNLSVQSYRVGVNIEHQLSDDLWLTAGAGFTFANEVEFMNTSGDTIRKEDYESGHYFTLGLRLHDW
jgi:hypothetical protein